MTVANSAPDFFVGPDGYHYPSDGKMLGPAWQAVWDALDDQEVTSVELVALMCTTSGIQVKTAFNLLTEARKAEWIQRRFVKRAGHNRRGQISMYRRADR
jgi:hypothetical protein